MTVVNHLTLEQLQHRIKQEKDPIAQLRFLAVYPAQRGLGAQEIAQLTTRTPRWVHATLQRYNPQGPQALSDRRHTNPGRRPKLRPEESAQVHKAHRPMAVFGRARNCGSGWRWRLSLNPIYRPGYRLKVPRPVHRKGDPAAQEANLCQRVEAARAMVLRLQLCGTGERGQPESVGRWDGQRGDELGAAGVSGLGRGRDSLGGAGSGGVARLPAGGGARGGGPGLPAALFAGATTGGADVAEAVANRYFETLEAMMAVVAERCQVLSADPATVRKHTLFHWWPRMKEST
ncbi:hypothetical protein Mesil_2955 [Allomeiothermus silvanus DSM 9946]|uniref:Uncharacterized protein n=1 Tax=Allomeiothermus silvanus (strain ATCC 700542 / DSM 9946 / NBRC 106475 / NCIMB 13440 / VI-R2) TaxID=526227 RepID=D7BDH5_ALLS1|nr:hypothetical protein [Allomeiothermus silvanus]ADH64795.1 hypothetical protein Mesil_2955 [Allomeiothermus silvanus DSM 9946]